MSNTITQFRKFINWLVERVHNQQFRKGFMWAMESHYFGARRTVTQLKLDVEFSKDLGEYSYFDKGIEKAIKELS